MCSHVLCLRLESNGKLIIFNPMAQPVKKLPAKAGGVGGAGSIPGSGRSPGGEHGSPLQHSCLENPMDTEAWRATIHSITESDITEVT